MSSRATLQKFVGTEGAWHGRSHLVKSGLDKHLARKDPSLLPRVHENYTIATGGDPHNPRGQSAEGQSERRYRKDCEDFEDDNKKLWANVLEAQDSKGDSKTMLMKCPVGKGIKAVEMPYGRYGKAAPAHEPPLQSCAVVLQ
jgi:hypothetical protein